MNKKCCFRGRTANVTSAGNLPTGFDPATLYNSRYHPRGMAMTIYGISDIKFAWYGMKEVLQR